MSDESSPLDHSKAQESGFTEAFVKECGINFEQEVAIIMEAMKDEYFDLQPSHLIMKKTSLKESLKVLNGCFSLLTTTHMKFVEEQEKEVYQICGFEYHGFEYFARFRGLLGYFPEMGKTMEEFERHYGECMKDIDKMIDDYEVLTEEIYNEYKSSLRYHILGLNGRMTAFIDLIMKQHVSNTWEEVEGLHHVYATEMATIQSSIELMETRQKAAFEEVQDKKERLDALKKKISEPDYVVSTIIEEIKNLKISETLAKLYNICNYWSSHIESCKSKVSDVCDQLYEAEVAMNGLRLKGLVNLDAILKLGLAEETKQRIDSLTDEMHSVLEECLEMAKARDSMEKSIGTSGEEQKHD